MDCDGVGGTRIGRVAEINKQKACDVGFGVRFPDWGPIPGSG